MVHGPNPETSENNEANNGLNASLFSEVSGLGPCTIRHHPSWKEPEAEAVAQRLAEARVSDARLGFTATGPHRDRFSFQLDGRSFGEHASTGQVRLLSLLLRIAQATLSLQRTGRKPLLLLDDVLLELDEKRRRNVLSRLPAYEQAFFTFLPGYELGRPARQLHVDSGHCSA